MSYSFGRNVLLSSVGFDRFIDALEEMSVEGVSQSGSELPALQHPQNQ